MVPREADKGRKQPVAELARVKLVEDLSEDECVENER